MEHEVYFLRKEKKKGRKKRKEVEEKKKWRPLSALSSSPLLHLLPIALPTIQFLFPSPLTSLLPVCASSVPFTRRKQLLVALLCSSRRPLRAPESTQPSTQPVGSSISKRAISIRPSCRGPNRPSFPGGAWPRRESRRTTESYYPGCLTIRDGSLSPSHLSGYMFQGCMLPGSPPPPLADRRRRPWVPTPRQPRILLPQPRTQRRD